MNLASEKYEKSINSQLKLKIQQLKAVITFLVIFFITCLSVVIILQFIAPKPKNIDNVTEKINTSKQVCTTPECIHLAHQLNNWQDPNIDPCVDFYKASCGRYIQHTSAMTDRHSEKDTINARLLKEFLSQNESSTLKSENNMRQLFRKCELMKGEKNSTNGSEKLIPELLRNIDSIGSWPLLDPNWDESKFDLNDILVNMAKVKMLDFGFFKFHTVVKFMLMPTFHRWSLLPPQNLSSLPKSILKANNLKIDDKIIAETIESAQNVSKNILKLLGMVEFEGMVKMSALQKHVPSIDFERILENLIDPRRLDYRKVMEMVDVPNIEFFFGKEQNLKTLLQTTPKREIANFLFFSYIFQFEQKGISPEGTCLLYIIQSLPLASLRYFAHNIFDKNNLKPLAEITDSMKTSFTEMIQKSTWLSEKTRRNAILKVEKMRVSLGVPEEEGWEERVERAHEMLDISSTDSFLAMKTKLDLHALHNIVEFAGTSLSLEKAQTFYVSNAFYEPAVNGIVISPPFTYTPHFDDSFPKYAQFAGVGETFGHEMGHGFDPNGLKFDENGVENDWWDPSDLKEYKERIQCLVHQYNDYNDPDYGRNLNGSAAIGEITSDFLGIGAAHIALGKIDKSKQPDVIGFEGHDIDQMFFRIHALDYCQPPSSIPLQIQAQRTHPTHSFRINGVFRNFEPFAKAFKCPVGSPMNPEKKCKLML